MAGRGGTGLLQLLGDNPFLPDATIERQDIAIACSAGGAAQTSSESSSSCAGQTQLTKVSAVGENPEHLERVHHGSGRGRLRHQQRRHNIHGAVTVTLHYIQEHGTARPGTAGRYGTRGARTGASEGRRGALRSRRRQPPDWRRAEGPASLRCGCPHGHTAPPPPPPPGGPALGALHARRCAGQPGRADKCREYRLVRAYLLASAFELETSMRIKQKLLCSNTNFFCRKRLKSSRTSTR